MLLSATIQSAIGIGYAMLASAVFAFIMAPTASAALIGYAAVVLGIYYSIRMRSHIKLKICIPPMLGMMVSRALGILTLMQMEPANANLVLGIVLLAFSAYFWLFSSKVRINPTPAKGFLLGLCAGYLGGMYGLTGPFSAVYFFSVLDDNRDFTACTNFAFLPSGIIGLIVHICCGNLTMQMMPECIVSTIAILAGIGIGIKLLGKLDYAKTAKAIYSFMAGMGITILVTNNI